MRYIYLLGIIRIFNISDNVILKSVIFCFENLLKSVKFCFENLLKSVV